MKIFKALMARALNITTETELNELCRDIDSAYQNEKIKADENELLYRLINKMNYNF